LPKNYPMTALIRVDRELMDALLGRQLDTRPAVTYRLGSAVMMGTSSKHSILGLEHTDAKDYEFAMGVGKGPLELGVGAVTRSRGGVLSSRLVTIYEGLKRGIRDSGTMPADELPPHVPRL
jgi:hypothetical protein